MYSKIQQFEPLIPTETGPLEDLALEVSMTSSKVAGSLPEQTLDGIRELLRIVNSYYSNLIEGHNSHPIDVERAMKADYSANQDKGDLQKESLIHISLQKEIEGWLDAKPEIEVTSPQFLCTIHKEFYDQLPDRFRWVKGDDDMEPAWVEAGALRARQVVVGNHLPPVAESLPAFLERFNQFYKPQNFHGTRAVVALAAAHHRLMWIHPFLDGNGRVARLFTDAYFRRIGILGYGLWNVSRGLARRSDEYKTMLAAADFHRENDLDGRGNLSERTLKEFCQFFLQVCLDQSEFMTSLLSLSGFLERLDGYVSLRANGLVADEKGIKIESLHDRAGLVLRETAIQGEISRGKVFELIEMSERSGRTVLRALMDEGLLIPSADSHKSAVRLGFPAHVAEYWFPKLFPQASFR